MTKKNLFKKQSCSPLQELSYTCYSTESLIKIKNKWNQKHPKLKIESNKPNIIWKKLKLLLSDFCNNEKCWLRQQFIKYNLDKNLLSYTFAPDRPTLWESNKNEWLDSNNILNVMDQYEKKYNNFLFIGPSPSNYDTLTYNNECVWNELCNFDLLYHLKNDKNKIAIIFNTDPHYKSGEHWVSIFINFECENPYIFYFDSTGDKIHKPFKKFIDNVILQSNNIDNIKLNYIHNYNIQHQKSNTECGMYCLYFIIQLLKNKKHEKHFRDSKNLISDKYVEKYRHIYFN